MDTYIAVLTLVILFIIQNLLNKSRPRSFPQTQYPVDHHDSTQTDSPPRPIRLVQINPLINEDTDIDLDIIAIHGFDARSPDTWTYKSKTGKPDVNWLKDPDMLPSIVGSARIFTCDWPSDFFESSSYVPKSFDDFVLGLLAGIKARATPRVCSIREGPPVLFVASCLGGILLMKALVETQTRSDDSILKATRGIVFLATPFRGTAFGDVAYLAEPTLWLFASFRSKIVSRLLDEVKEHSGLTKLVGDFTRLVKKDGPFMAVFFETKKTHLPRRIGPFQISVFRKERLLVSENSSILDIVDNRQALDRSHGMMNKFEGPQDNDYYLVATKVKTMVNDIREGRPLEQAWAYIREKHYNDKKLEIVRLSNSGGSNRNLKMSECYVNLVIIEQHSKGKSQSEADNPQRQSPFSLTGRLSVETPEKDLQVELYHLFDSRKDDNGREFQAQKILIRGQAGVGKTTLCKKMIHDFTRHDMWNDLFDRILWIPLRNLKLLPPDCVDLRELFQSEYFRNTPNEKERFSMELYRQVNGARDQRTLFVLDGLDEVHEALDESHKHHDLLKELLGMPACIVTSRPRVVLPDYCKDKFDLELETIGFYPEQVTSYIEKTITSSQKEGPDLEGINELQPLLRQHQLLQQLVRIPIQLDALCFIWETDRRAVLGESKLETMTSIYQAIMRSLWRKDVLRSNMEVHNKPVASSDIQNMPLDQLENFFPVGALEKLAFERMVHDTISFTESQAMATPSSTTGLAGPLTAGMLAGISCLRTHDASTEDPVYHFIHLTFQEYFAARHFVRHWLSKTSLLKGQKNSLSSPSSFIKHYKYDNRYDIFWRFVTGLLSPGNQGQDLIEFYEELQNEPIDLVGPVHQRLLMHCLSEVPLKHATFSARRNDLENKLSQWGVWEYRCNDSYRRLKLLREAEFPKKSLLVVLHKSLPGEKRAIVEALSHRPVIPLPALRLLCSWLEQDVDYNVKINILGIIRQKSTSRDDEIVGAVKARFEDESDRVQISAIETFGDWNVHTQRSYLLEDLKALAIFGRSRNVRLAALKAIGKQRHLDPHSIKFLGEQLQSWLDEDVNSGEIPPKTEMIKCCSFTYSETPKERNKIPRAPTGQEIIVKRMTITALGQHKDLPSDILQLILAHIQNKHDKVQEATFKAVQLHFSNDSIFEIIELWLKNGKPSTQKAATSILRYWPQLSFKVANFIKTQLKHEDETIRRAFIKGLQDWHTLNDEFLDAVTECLQDESHQIRYRAIVILGRDPRFKDRYIDVFKSQVQHDEVLSCQTRALHFLLDRLSFEDLGFDLISEWIRNPALRSTCLELIAERPQVCPDPSLEFMELLVRPFRPCLEEDPWLNYRDKQATFSILANFHVADRHIRDKSLEAIINGLKHDDRDVQTSAAEALLKWPQVENHYFKEVLKHFSERGVGGRRYYEFLLKALINWSSSLGEDDLLVTTVARALERKELELERFGFGAQILGNLPQPNDGLVNQICQNLNDLNGSLQEEILQALGCWSELKPPVLQVIAKMLNNKSMNIRVIAFQALVNQSCLLLREMEPFMEAFYQIFLRLSFTQHFYWLYENGKCTVMLGSRALLWKDEHGNIETWFSLEPGTTERWREEFVDEFPYLDFLNWT